MILTALMLVVLASPEVRPELHPGGGHGPASDTITIGAVWDLLNTYYHEGAPLARSPQRDLFVTVLESSSLECRGGEVPMCWEGGDPDDRYCFPGTVCRRDRTAMLDRLKEWAIEYPEAGFVNGQAVYALVKHRRAGEALALARACRAQVWWCAVLEGHALHALGRLDEARTAFAAGLPSAPETLACEARDASRLLGSWAASSLAPGSSEWRVLQESSCEARIEVSRRIWWLSDPLYSVAGNDRWVEHANRTVAFRLQTDFRGRLQRRPYHWGGHRALEHWDRAFSVRRGSADGWVILQSGTVSGPWGYAYRTVSPPRARYHFVPDFEGDDLASPTWRLLATQADEGYTPSYGTFHELPTQIARFRSPDTRGDSMRVAAAATLVGTELTAARAPEPHLILTDAPQSFPVHVTGAFDEQRTSTFLVASETGRYVLSYEVLSDGRYGWHRQMLEPLEGTGAGMSDVLLYRPDDPAPPEALEPAAALMLGEPAVARGAELGVFWEAYGAPAGTEVTVELEIEGGGGGFFSRLRNLLPGGGAAPVRLSWSEPSPGEVFPRGVSLGTEGLEPGSYTLVVRIAWEGQDVLETIRSLEVRSRR